VKAAATVPGRAPRTRRPVARRCPERCPAPVRSAVLLRCDGLAALIPVQPCGPRWSGRVAERAFDFIIGAALLMACTPLLRQAVVRWLCGGRPVLFRQIRATRPGGLMQITKLRTITVQNPDAEGTVSHDQCTTVSRLLRSAHLVELPQLLNEIRRQISLIGPRPERPLLTLLES
jgi:Bacterial sugar transferase